VDTTRVRLGEVTSPSGIVVIVDTGCIPLWQQNAPPPAELESTVKAQSGAACVTYAGSATAVVVTGVPSGVPLPVYGVPLPSDPYGEYWASVYLEIRAGIPVQRSEEAGMVGVDYARLTFADLYSLRAWEHDASLDGKADIAFWAGDAEAVARELGAMQWGDEFGWRDLPRDQAEALFVALERVQLERGWRMAMDFRPHSHHHAILEQMRTTETQSGTLDVGRARLCAFFSLWGDGFYPVLRDVDAEGELVRIRVDLAGEDENAAPNGR